MPTVWVSRGGSYSFKSRYEYGLAPRKSTLLRRLNLIGAILEGQKLVNHVPRPQFTAGSGPPAVLSHRQLSFMDLIGNYRISPSAATSFIAAEGASLCGYGCLGDRHSEISGNDIRHRQAPTWEETVAVVAGEKHLALAMNSDLGLEIAGPSDVLARAPKKHHAALSLGTMGSSQKELCFDRIVIYSCGGARNARTENRF
ncbi:hypothetical protein F5148DRAFT_1149955 [Russula earlei]|uniref:Uncharacterized protein n=1 Tax=Russula earlei TaxID=71964 RepID=A0ACC0U693_9AGAM|nr:hypothetical protein F5148DRAFT_1149955 [Russula earlei]